MNILITGGTGFIGSRLALRLLGQGEEVGIFGQINTSAEKDNLERVRAAGGEVQLGSVVEREKVREAVRGKAVVFHLAAAQHEANVPDQHFRDINVEGTRNILEASLTAGVKRFVHGSTIGVYGSVEGMIDEESPCNPENIYGKTKLEGERLALSFNDKIPITAIRICETYGPGDRRLLKLFKAIQKKSFFMIGNGKNLHHLIYIDDLIKGLLLAATNERARGEIFLLAGKKPITTSEMAETIALTLDSPLPKLRAPLWPFMTLATVMEGTLRPLGVQPPLHRRRMDFFKKSFSISSQKAARLLGFSPDVDFTLGAKQTARWYGEQGLLDMSGAVVVRDEAAASPATKFPLTAQIEPFDTFWEAPKNIEKGYTSFGRFYTHNYLKYITENKDLKILVVSCGPGYFVNLLKQKGYTNVLGIDSSPERIASAQRHHLNCQVDHAYDFLEETQETFDLIFGEQEINHLTKEEILQFLKLCCERLRDKGVLIVHSLNGANPITGAEALAQNIDHYNTFTEYSLRQMLHHSGFGNIKVFPLNLYVFYNNPMNYVGILLNAFLGSIFRSFFAFYGKSNKIFSKKIGAVCVKST